MTSKKRPMTGRLLMPIHTDDARARGLRASFALDPDRSDILAHVGKEWRVRWADFDKLFGIKANDNGVDIWQQRAKALVAYEFDIDPRDPQWWGHFAAKLAFRYVPGFSVKGPGQKRHGAPREWNDEQLCQLFADVEFLKKQNAIRSVRAACVALRSRKGYAKRWGRYPSEALRRAYVTANKMRRQRLHFQLQLCGAAASIPANRIDPIEAAIDLHALKL